MRIRRRVVRRGVAGWSVWPLLALGVVAAPGAAAQAGDPRAPLVTVLVSPRSVTVGDPFTVRVRVRAPKVASVRFPDVPPSADGVDPVDPRAIEEGAPGEFLDRTAVYTFVAWDVGRRRPQFGPVVISVAGQERAFPVGADAAVDVRSTLPADTTDRAPRDARAPVPLPGRLWQYLVLAVVFSALVAWWWWRRRARRGEVGQQAEPEPWNRAREAFAALDALALADAGEPGRHAIAHVDVLRAYIERRFPDLTASLDGASFVAALATTDFPLPSHRMATLLDRDGTLRFAHAEVTTDEAVTLAAEARDIVARLQLAYEARLRAMERPPRPRRR